MIEDLTAERLRKKLKYDLDTGHFYWRRKWASGCRTDKPAGGPDCNKGYHVIKVDGRRYYAHRLAWLYTFGSWPLHYIDHINQDRSDNRIANLRPATESENSCNRIGMSASGVKGVYWTDEGWATMIQKDGKRTWLGKFQSLEQARITYNAAAALLHGDFAKPND